MPNAETGQGTATPVETYERNPVNNSSLGTDFEANVAIYSILTLLNNENHAIAIEYKAAPAKFDDVVLRVRNGRDYGYYYHQLKHRDTAQDPDAYLTWNDLLTANKSKFGLPWYYACLLKQRNPPILENVKELAFVTNYNLVRQGSNRVNDIMDLAQKLLHGDPKASKYHVTNGDLKSYFLECHSSNWRPVTLNQKSFKFTPGAISAILQGTAKAGLSAANKKSSMDLSAYEEFLGFLVFRVSMPHVDELKTINQQILNVFLVPFHKNLTSHYGDVAKELMLLFQKEPQATATDDADIRVCQAGVWATAETRRLHVEKIAGLSEFSTVPIVSGSYKSDLTLIFREIMQTSTKWIRIREPMQVVNVYNDDSNAIVITMKLIKIIQSESLRQNGSLHKRTVIEQVQDKNALDDISKHYEELEKKTRNYGDLMSESYCCIIRISPFFTHFSESNNVILGQLADRLTTMTNLRKRVQFIIVTQLPFAERDSSNLKRIKELPLKWQDLSEDFKKELFEKTLYLGGNKETNLRALIGFEQFETIDEWLHPRALAELIIHDRGRPIHLGLPKKDASLETDYIEREIQLPLVKFDPVKQSELLFTCNEADFNGNDSVQTDQPANEAPEYQHLLSPVISISHKNACLWIKAKDNRSICEVKKNVVRSKHSDVTLNEEQLLEDDVNFGTGSTDNKLLVVVDYPGKGKSYLLTSLSNRLLDGWSKHPNRLLLRVNLREVKDWRKHSNGVEFLLNHSKTTESDLKTGNAYLTAAIVERKCTSGPPSVFFFLDGYDEISDEQRQVTLNVIDSLLEDKGIKRIILTSRPETNLERGIEERFHQFSLHLKNFDRDTQIRYLTKRWKSKIEKRNSSYGSDERIHAFVQKFVSFAAVTLKSKGEFKYEKRGDEHVTFLDIPLQCWIFSECFFQQLVQYLESNNESVPEFHKESFEILSLYDRFFEAKIDVLLQEKANITINGDNEVISFLRNEMKEVYLRSLMRLSVLHMMEKIDEAECICRLKWENYQSAGDDVSEFSTDLKRAIKLGIVQGYSEDDKPFDSFTETRDIKFLHRTFAEYFFAKYLLQNFTREKSDLLDDSIFSQEVIDKSFELITDKIFAGSLPEFAGVRRFLDRMLVKHVPPVAGEQCPFAKEDRLKVIKKWPAIGHERLNEQLAKSTISKSVNDYAKLPFRGNFNGSKLSEEDYKHLRELGMESEFCTLTWKDCDKMPHITSMLIYCIKEYASRQDTPNEERQALAYSITLSSIRWVWECDYGEPDEGIKLIASCLLRWFDRTDGLSIENNHIFSKWIFILLGAMSREKSYLSEYFAVVACEMLEQHRHDPDFDNNIYVIASSLLFAMADKNPVYWRFFEVDSNDLNDCFRRHETRPTDVLFEGMLVSLTARNVISPALLQRLADFLVNKLELHIGPVAHFHVSNIVYDLLEHTGTQEDAENTFLAKLQLLEEFLKKNVVRPYAFDETFKFFVSNLSKLPEATTVKFKNVFFRYAMNIRPLLSELSRQMDLCILCIGALMRDGLLMSSKKYETQIKIGETSKLKVLSTSLALWYFQFSDAILSQLPDYRVMTTQATQNVFFTEFGKLSLTAYAFASCCCQCKNNGRFTGFGIHFGRELDCELMIKKFRSFFANKLELLWNEKSEISFIDFLIKRDDFITDDKQKYKARNDKQSTTSHQTKDGRLRKAESDLKAIRLARLPCLLFSDSVAEYIPQKLSPTGLNHLINTLKTLSLFICKQNCFQYSKSFVGVDASDFIPVMRELKMSLLDGILQEDEMSPKIFRCKNTSAQIKALRERLWAHTTAEQVAHLPQNVN